MGGGWWGWGAGGSKLAEVWVMLGEVIVGSPIKQRVKEAKHRGRYELQQ